MAVITASKGSSEVRTTELVAPLMALIDGRLGSVHTTVGVGFLSAMSATLTVVIQSGLDGVLVRSRTGAWVRDVEADVADALVVLIKVAALVLTLVLTTLVPLPAALLVVVLAMPVEDAAVVVVGVGVVTVVGSCMCTAIFKPSMQGVLSNDPMDSPS